MYNKLFTKILDSSIWLQPTPTRIVWVTLLAAMDEHGFAQFAAVGNVAQRAMVTLEEARRAIDVLESPDPDSSDPAGDGRRIERVPGGWMVLNAGKYRSLSTRADSQAATRERVRRHREKKRGNAHVTAGNARVTPSEAEAEAEVEATQAIEPPAGVSRPGKDKKPHEVKELLAEHDRLFKAKYGDGTAYSEKDAKHAKEIVRSYGLARAKQLLAVFFDADDPFFAQTGHAFGAFRSCLTKVVALAAKHRTAAPAEMLYDCPTCGECHIGADPKVCSREQGRVYRCRVCGRDHQGHNEWWCPVQQINSDDLLAKAV